jgi:sec-independent protein translocase protein TatA
MPNIGPLEIGIVLIIALIVLGPKKLPDMGRSLGKGMREFKSAITGNDEEEREHELVAAHAAEPEVVTRDVVKPTVVKPEVVTAEVVKTDRSATAV